MAKSKIIPVTFHTDEEKAALIEVLQNYMSDCSVAEINGGLLIQNIYGKHILPSDFSGLGWYANGFIKGYRVRGRG